MRRFPLLLLLVMALAVVPAVRPAYGHGAGFGPRPPTPPPAPQDRAPPPPPPPPPSRNPPPVHRPPAPVVPGPRTPPSTQAPPSTAPSAPAWTPPVGKTPATPVPTAPGVAPPRTAAPGTGGAGPRPTDFGPRFRRAPDPENTWQTWWGLNRSALLPDRLEGLRRRVVTPSEDGPTLEDAWEVRRHAATRTQILPFLLRLLDPRDAIRNDVRASALIATAKVAQDRLVVRLLFHWLEDGRAAPLVRESAALAVGLLRRTRPDLQMDGATLDDIRGRLFDVHDDRHAPRRTRAFAALALGILADQPYGDRWTTEGRLVVRGLWQRLSARDLPQDLSVALLVALGRQPSCGVPDAVRTGLRNVTLGKRSLKRKWNAIERSHALTALIRLGGPSLPVFLRRILERKRESKEVRRAAFAGLAEIAPLLDAEDRKESVRALLRSIRYAKDPLTEGLGLLAAGTLLGADLAAGQTGVLDQRALPQLLRAEAQRGQVMTRGFACLAIGIAAHDVRADSRPAGVFRHDAARILHAGLERGRGDDRLLGAYAVGLGLVGATESEALLLGILEDRGRDPELRGHCAVALGQIGSSRLDVRRALDVALLERRTHVLQREAALALALLGGHAVSTQLLRELRNGKTERLLGQVVIALGQLGDLKAVETLVRHASETGRSELAQALGVVALGRLADPEARPSLLRLTRNANYPARTDALHEAYTIL